MIKYRELAQTCLSFWHARIQRGTRGLDTLETLTAVFCLRNTVLDPLLSITKLPIQCRTDNGLFAKARIVFIFNLQTLLLNFWEGRKTISLTSKFFFIYPLTLNMICFVEKSNIFLRFCLSVFESDTVKNDCPIQAFKKMMKNFKGLIQTVGLPY